VIHPTLEDVGLPVSNDSDESKEPFEAALRAVEVERYQGNPYGPDIAANLTFPEQRDDGWVKTSSIKAFE
jgi:hypothetical protein